MNGFMNVLCGDGNQIAQIHTGLTNGWSMVDMASNPDRNTTPTIFCWVLIIADQSSSQWEWRGRDVTDLFQLFLLPASSWSRPFSRQINADLQWAKVRNQVCGQTRKCYIKECSAIVFCEHTLGSLTIGKHLSPLKAVSLHVQETGNLRTEWLTLTVQYTKRCRKQKAKQQHSDMRRNAEDPPNGSSIHDEVATPKSQSHNHHIHRKGRNTAELEYTRSLSGGWPLTLSATPTQR